MKRFLEVKLEKAQEVIPGLTLEESDFQNTMYCKINGHEVQISTVNDLGQQMMWTFLDGLMIGYTLNYKL